MGLESAVIELKKGGNTMQTLAQYIAAGLSSMGNLLPTPSMRAIPWIARLLAVFHASTPRGGVDMKGFTRYSVLLFVLLLTVALPAGTLAETEVSGMISSDQTWTVAGSPYVVVGSVLVSSEVTLLATQVPTQRTMKRGTIRAVLLWNMEWWNMQVVRVMGHYK